MHTSATPRHSRALLRRAGRLGAVLSFALVLAALGGTAVATPSTGPAAFSSTSAPSGSASSGSASSGPGSSGSASSGGASGAGRATFGIGPATKGKVDQRGYFSYIMGVGGIYDDQAAVLNYGSTPLTLTVFAADLGNAPDGTITVGLQNEAREDAGGWIKLAGKQLTVRVPPATRTAVGRVILPFRISVPTTASPGDHGAALVAVLSTLGKNPKGENVRLDQRVASRIYLRVNGPLHPALQVEKLSVSYHRSMSPLGGGSATVRYTVHNVGNVRLAAAQQQVSVTGLLGTRSKAVAPPDLPLLFPGASSVVTVRIPGVIPAVLEKAHVTLTPQLSSDQKPMALSKVTAAKSFTALPWPSIVYLLLLILLAVLGLRLQRAARRRPRGGRHGARRDSASRPRPLPQTPETISS